MTKSDGSWGESFPDDGFTDIGGDEERNTGAETIDLWSLSRGTTISGYELDNKEEMDACTGILGLSVKTF